MPFTHLQGRRNKLRQRHRAEKDRAREETIQYDSSMRLLNSEVMEIRKEKDQFQKNQYKFENVSSGKVGKEKGGFLELSKNDIARIRGKSDRPRNMAQGKPRHGKSFKNKHQKHGKNKRR